MNSHTRKLMNDMIHNVEMGLDGLLTVISPANAPIDAIEFYVLPHKVGVIEDNNTQYFLLKDLNLEKLNAYKAIITLAEVFIENKLVPAIAVRSVIVNNNYQLTMEICSLMMDYCSSYRNTIDLEIAKKQ